MTEEKEETLNLDTLDGQIALIEAVLFVSKDPVKPEQIITFLSLTGIEDFDKIITEMEARYNKGGRGITLRRAGGGLQLYTKPLMHDYLKDFFTKRMSAKLTIPSLETLSIIAYKQPITIAEISDLRGVNSVGPVKSLLQKKLIKITGRKKVPGLPALYATTKEFLLYFGLNNLSELPSLEELTEMFEEKEQPSLFN